MQKIVVAKALIFNDKDQLLLVRRSETAPRRPLEWDFPGGFVEDDDESYQHACMREIEEETGLHIAHKHLSIVYAESAINNLVSDKADVTWLYFTGTADSTDVKLSFEHSEFTWVSLEEALKINTYDRQVQALQYLQSVRSS